MTFYWVRSLPKLLFNICQNLCDFLVFAFAELCSPQILFLSMAGTNHFIWCIAQGYLEQKVRISTNWRWSAASKTSCRLPSLITIVPVYAYSMRARSPIAVTPFSSTYHAPANQQLFTITTGFSSMSLIPMQNSKAKTTKKQHAISTRTNK